MTMTPSRSPLEGCFVRLERAEELIIALSEEIDRLRPSYAVERGNDVMRRRLTFRVVGPPLPSRISTLTGEVIHHLRAIFDNVAWVFAERAVPPVRDPRSIQFPVADDAHGFANAIQRGAITGMPEAARTLAEALQPYRAASPDRSVLKLLHALDIEDKHRRPLAMTHAALMGESITLRGHLTTPITIILPPPPSDGAFLDEEHGEALRYIRYESEEDQPDLQAEYSTVIDVVLRHPFSQSPQPQALDTELRHMAAFTMFALREFADILPGSP